MKNCAFLIFVVLVLVSPNFAVCDETRSYNKIWTVEARNREASREERNKHYDSLTPEQRMRISDIEIYPTFLMTCGMGFSEGLAKVFVDAKAGFINEKGEIVIEPKFKDAGRFSESLAAVEFENGKWGYINKTGNVVIEPLFDWALAFRENLALIQISEKWGFIDSTGKIVVKPQFDHANNYSEGLAHVQLYREKFYSGYINKKGEWAIQPTFNGGQDFFQGKAIVDQDVKDDKGNYKYTECFLINKSGKKLKALDTCSRADFVRSFRDSNEIGLFFDDYKTGYKDKAGKIIWKPTK